MKRYLIPAALAFALAIPATVYSVSTISGLIANCSSGCTKGQAISERPRCNKGSRTNASAGAVVQEDPNAPEQLKGVKGDNSASETTKWPKCNKGKRDNLAQEDSNAAPEANEESRRNDMKAALKGARIASAKGNTAECLTKANEALTLGAGSSAHMLLGLCHEKAGDSDQASKHYNNWLESNPTSKLAPKFRQKITALGGTPVN